MTKLVKMMLPVGAIVIGAIAALATRSPGKAEHQHHSSSMAAPATTATTATPENQGKDSATIAGSALEVINVAKYTYIRVGAANEPGQWTAVPSAKVAVGDAVRVVDAHEMRDFQSGTLNRKFPVIYFGILDSGAAAPAAAAAGDNNPHGMPPSNTTDSQSPTVAAGSASSLNPHAAPAPESDLVPVGKVAKAKGALGRTVAAIYAESAQLKGKQVRIRAVVVKVVSNVMGRTFLHLRDGTGNKATGTHDLTVTTSEQPKVGDTVLYEGTVATDIDFGSGYRYPVLVQEARTVTE